MNKKNKMNKKSPVREMLISRLVKKYGVNNRFRFTDLQREVVEMHGMNYDEMETISYYGKVRKVRKYRGWYCCHITKYHDDYLYKPTNGLKLKRTSRGYMVVNCR